jgi:hypothetical protein
MFKRTQNPFIYHLELKLTSPKNIYYQILESKELFKSILAQ